MSRSVLNITGFSVLFAGVLMLTNLIGITDIPEPLIAAMVMMLFGFSVVLFSHKFKRGIILLGGMVFTVGVALFVVEKYEILSVHNVFLPTLFFALGTGFASLFTENRREFSLLFIAVSFYALGLLTVTVLKNFGLIEVINQSGMFFVEFWPVAAIIAILAFLLRQRNS